MSDLSMTDDQINDLGRQVFERHCGRPHPFEGLQPWVIALVREAVLQTQGVPAGVPMSDAARDAARDVLAERQRQISVEGWTPEHDDEHSFEEMAFAASCYACADEGEAPPAVWPWDWKWWKPKGRRRNLVKAGALILAEIERLDRATASGAQ